MKKVILILTICSMGCLTAYTQTKEQSIKELFHLMQQDSMLNKVLNSFTIPLNLPMPGADPASQAKMAEAMKSSMQLTATIMKRLLDEDMLQIYDKNFTQKEINDYIAFYKSPSGQKMITAMPSMQKDIMTVITQKYMPLMMQEMKKRVEEMKIKQ